MAEADIGVFGGSGFYSFLDDVEEVKMETPYGAPSDSVMLAKVGNRRVAFLPRHGRNHSIPPHKINYRANAWVMKELGVRRIFGPCAAGSLKADIPPGTFVLADQFVDRTKGRADTFFEGPEVRHVSAADPYCPEMRKILYEVGEAQGLPIRPAGTMVVIQGPRFSTRAESRFYAAQGWDVIGMTQYPEAILARELGICYANISMVTDYDAGLEDDPDILPVTHEQVLKVFNENIGRLKDLLLQAIQEVPLAERNCRCGE